MSMWFIKRNRLIIGFTLGALLCHAMQLALINPFLSIDEYRPDLLLILALFAGFRFGHVSGAMLGFYAGLLQDLMTGFLGIHALAKTLAGYGVYYFSNRHVLVIERYYFPVVVLLLALFHDAVYYYVYALGAPLEFRPLFGSYAVPNAAYSAVLALILMLGIPRHWLAYLRETER